jgi:hypothetical protein
MPRRKTPAPAAGGASPPPPAAGGTKACPGCGSVKPLTAYWANKRSTDGRHPECAACASGRLKRRPDRAPKALDAEVTWRQVVEDEAGRHRRQLVRGWVNDAVQGDRAARKQLMEYLLGPPRVSDDGAATRFYRALVGAFTDPAAGADVAEPPALAGDDGLGADGAAGDDLGGPDPLGHDRPQEGD